MGTLNLFSTMGGMFSLLKGVANKVWAIASHWGPTAPEATVPRHIVERMHQPALSVLNNSAPITNDRPAHLSAMHGELSF